MSNALPPFFDRVAETRGPALFTLLAGLALALVQTPLQAQTVDPLGHLVEEALRNNLTLEQVRLSEERAGAEVREARGLFLPSLSVETRYSEQNGTLNFGDFVNPAYAALNEMSGTNRFPTDLDFTLPFRHESRLRLTQPLFNETIRANYALSRHRRDATRYARMASERRVAAEAQVAYLSLAGARSAVRIYEASLALVRENERVAERLVEAGRATPDVIFRARAERSDVEQQLLEAGERARAARRALNLLLGRRLDAEVEEVPDSLLRFELAITEDAAVAHALAHREELRRLDAGLSAADAAVRVATAAFLPSVSLAIDYGFQGQELSFGSDQDFLVASVVVSWNLFNGGRDLARRQGAGIEADRIRVQRRDVEDHIRLEVRQAYESAAVARAAIGTAEDRLAAARRTFQLVRRRYEEGVASHIEFLDARTALTSAELNRSVTAYRYAARYVELERAAALRSIDPDR